MPRRIWGVFKKALVIAAFLAIFVLALSVVYWQLYEQLNHAGWAIPGPMQSLADVVRQILDCYKGVLEALVALFYSLPMIGHGG